MEGLYQQGNKENLQPKKSIFNGSNLQQQLSKYNNKSQKNTFLNSSTSTSNNNNNFYELNTKDPKVQKTLVDIKIQQLHDKMKAFFNQQRKTLYNEIGPQIEQLQKSIKALRQQINRKKSNQQIQLQRIQLTNKKTFMLIELQKLSSNIKQKKVIMMKTNIQKEELQRQIKTAIKTLSKYKQKIQNKKNINMISTTAQNSNKNENEKVFCCQYEQQKSQINLDKIHITQVQVDQKKLNKLPLIKKGQSKVLSTWIQSSAYQNSLNHSSISTFSNYNSSERKRVLNSSRFQLSTQIKRYVKKLNAQTWSQVQVLFQTFKKSKFQKLSQLLIDQLRKKQSIKYHEKGYGQGFNGSKTHQMKLQIRKILKNYKTDDFFKEVMNKKVIKKQLNQIFQSLQISKDKNDKKLI